MSRSYENIRSSDVHVKHANKHRVFVLLYKRPCSDSSISPDVDGKTQNFLSHLCGCQNSTAHGDTGVF